MNITHVVPYYPPHLGGMEIVAQELSEELAKRGHNVDVVTAAKPLRKGIAKINGVTVHRLASLEVAHTPIMPRLIPTLRALNKGIMHIHIAQAFQPEIAAAVAKARKIPYIAHIHLDVGPSGKLGFLLPAYKKIVLKRILVGAAKVVVLTESHKEFIHKQYSISRDHIRVIPNGINKQYFVTPGKRKKPIILALSRLSVQKDIPLLIDAVSIMKSKAEVRIVGSGDQKELIEKHISKMKHNSALLLGEKSGKEKLKEFSNAMVFAMPSEREGLPLTLLEAMAAGLPIVASDIPGIKEPLSSAGILVEKRTPVAFANALDKVISSKTLRAKLTKKSVTRAKLYRWEKITKEFEKLYAEVSHGSK